MRDCGSSSLTCLNFISRLRETERATVEHRRDCGRNSCTPPVTTGVQESGSRRIMSRNYGRVFKSCSKFFRVSSSMKGGGGGLKEWVALL